MKIFINDREIHLAPGMTVRHAIIAAGFTREIDAGEKVFDEWGNEVGLDGAVSEKYRLYVEVKKAR